MTVLIDTRVPDGAAPAKNRIPWGHRVEVVAAALAAAAAIFAALFAGYQTRELRLQSTAAATVHRAELNAHMQEQMVALDNDFVERPQLRPYFYENWPPPKRGMLRRQVLAEGEKVIDLAAAIASSADLMGSSAARSWTSILSAYFSQSPAVRRDWSLYAPSYSAKTAAIMHAPSRRAVVDQAN